MDRKKQKIVQLSSVHPLYDTRIFHKISKSLVNAGYEVDLIIQHKKDEKIEEINVKALPLARQKLDRPLKIIPRLFYKAIQYPSGTIFHFHDPELIPIGLLLKFFGYKVIYDVHENTPKDFLTKEWFPVKIRGFMSELIEALEKLGDLYLDALVTTTNPISERFKNPMLIEIRNYPIIPKIIFEAESIERVKGRAIYVGDITYRRGIKEMVMALNLVPKTELYLGGKFSPTKIYDEVSKIKGWEKCIFLGWLHLDEVWENLLKSEVGMVTIQINESHKTQLPVKLFEYMLAGLPVISSDIAMYREIIEKENCGLIVDPKFPEEIAKAIKWIQDHPKEAREMGKNGRKAVFEKYNWANEEEKLLKLYSELERI